jgi:carboxypeptidase C (cathepsin A)
MLRRGKYGMKNMKIVVLSRILPGMLLMACFSHAQGTFQAQHSEITIPQTQQLIGGQQRPPLTPIAPDATKENSLVPPHHDPLPEEKTSVTHHSARIGGQVIKYTATAGTFIIKADDGTPKATFFYVAYTRDGIADVSSRPITIAYNGGPGSASLFTHLGFGPKRVVLTSDGHGLPAPYKITDNEDSFLDVTDLVFVDAVSTGYSRPAPSQDPSQFYGIIKDANYFADFIYQYINRNQRWNSPKYLTGESYGTTRSAELAGILQVRHEIYLNGIVLFSSVAFSDISEDNKYAYFLPTFTATAWYHHLLSPELQAESLEQVVQQSREFAHNLYATALEKGDLATPEEHRKTVEEFARLTALSPKYIEESNLRVSSFRWFKELERDKRRTIGRLDSRFEGYDVDAAGEREEYDPSEASYEGAYAATFHDYIRRDLNWNADGYYTITANVRPWDQTGSQQVAEVLRSAITQQTYLKVLVVCGYYDVATPFNGIEHVMDHMHLEPSLKKNISFVYYEAGHMVYIDDQARHKLHMDIDAFIDSSYPH